MCHFHAFWVGSNPTRNNFLRFLKQNNKRKKLWKNRKFRRNIGKSRRNIGNYREKSEKVENFREKSDKRNFCAFFFSRLTEKRYFGEISAEKTEIFVHGYIYHILISFTYSYHLFLACSIYSLKYIYHIILYSYPIHVS